MKPLSHSYSSIKLYDQCPRKYKYLRITKEVTEPQGEHAAYGEWVHKCFEEFVGAGAPLPSTLAVWANALDKFKGCEKECEKAVVLDEELKPIKGTDAWFSPGAWLRGKLDLYVRLTPRSVLVCDYKTGKRKPDFDQLEMFALFVFAYEPEVEVVIGTFLWTQHPEAGLQDQRTYQRSEANALWAKHLSRIRKIYDSHEHDNWPTRPSGLCKWKSGQCAAYDICPSGGGK